MHIPFFSEPEAIPIKKSNWSSTKQDAYLSWNCLRKQGCFSKCSRAPVSAPAKEGSAWQVAAWSAFTSLVHNWEPTELVLSSSELSAANRIPPGCSSSTFPCPARRFPVLVLLAALSISWKAGAARGLVLPWHVRWVPQRWGPIQLAG